MSRSHEFANSVSATITPTDDTATSPADYDNTAIKVSFTDTETTKSLVIPIVDDALVEGSETIRLALGNPTGDVTIGIQENAILNIVDNDSPSEDLTLVGGDTSDTLTGGNGNDTLDGVNGRDTLSGGDGSDILIGGLGGDIMTGGNGRDQFVYRSFSERSDKITDFNNGGDMLLLNDLLHELDYNGSDPFSDKYIQLVKRDSSTEVQIDSDGPSGFAAFKTLVTLENLLPTDLSTSNFNEFNISDFGYYISNPSF